MAYPGRGGPPSSTPRLGTYGHLHPRGAAPPPGPGRGGPPPGFPRGPPADTPSILDHVTTIGVRRAAFGSSGREIIVRTNHFGTTIPSGLIYHYDVVISPSEKTLPARVNMDLITDMQKLYPNTFTHKCVYDGRKNLFAPTLLQLTQGLWQEFTVSSDPSASQAAAAAALPAGKKGGPKIYKIKLTRVAEINPDVLSRFLRGEQSHDSHVLTAITALNVVIRMEPTIKYPFNVRSFFTSKETKDIGNGIVLWRGYFQSIRPAQGKMIINVDISTGTMYKPGNLLERCIEFFGFKATAANLYPDNPRGRPLSERDRLRLSRWLSGVRIHTEPATKPPPGTAPPPARVVKRVTNGSAKSMRFSLREGGTMTVEDYFYKTYNKRLQHPLAVCVEVGSGAILPLELCTIPAGQIMRKQVPPEKTKDVLDFATKKPSERLASITNGLSVLNYGGSEYVREFGLRVSEGGPLALQARVLRPPKLVYGGGPKGLEITPKDGAWNMVDKKFWQASVIKGWLLVVCDPKFEENNVNSLVKGLRESARDVGIDGFQESPGFSRHYAANSIGDHLKKMGLGWAGAHGAFPNLVVVVLPEGSAEMYHGVKHFGDITVGIATQCLKSSKCSRAKAQYYANVLLKVNVKLGGVNLIPHPNSVPFLVDERKPTLILGADVIHPAPGAEGKPSFTSLVGNVDRQSCKYVATSRVQISRQEIIADMGNMTEYILSLYSRYQQKVEGTPAPAFPARILFFRDGVSEGQFKTVIDEEIPAIKRACAKVGINPIPTLTFIVVGKRHHVRFFPSDKDSDKSGNCPAGTVVDREIAHPTEFDFYLQSHGGLLGTSRPAHYNVLYDENGLSPDDIQSLSFSLCHVYARSTRSVSIPAPVYYADIVCSRAKHHYDPTHAGNLTDDQDQDQSQRMRSLEQFKVNFKDLHRNSQTVMYFS